MSDPDLQAWVAWQREHAEALADREGQRAYHRTIAGSAVASSADGPFGGSCRRSRRRTSGVAALAGDHAEALEALQEAQRAYHRTIAGSAFANPTEGPRRSSSRRSRCRARSGAAAPRRGALPATEERRMKRLVRMQLSSREEIGQRLNSPRTAGRSTATRSGSSSRFAIFPKRSGSSIDSSPWPKRPITIPNPHQLQARHADLFHAQRRRAHGEGLRGRGGGRSPG